MKEIDPMKLKVGDILYIGGGMVREMDKPLRLPLFADGTCRVYVKDIDYPLCVPLNRTITIMDKPNE